MYNMLNRSLLKVKYIKPGKICSKSETVIVNACHITQDTGDREIVLIFYSTVLTDHFFFPDTDPVKNISFPGKGDQFIIIDITGPVYAGKWQAKQYFHLVVISYHNVTTPVINDPVIIQVISKSNRACQHIIERYIDLLKHKRVILFLKIMLSSFQYYHATIPDIKYSTDIAVIRGITYLYTVKFSFFVQHGYIIRVGSDPYPVIVIYHYAFDNIFGQFRMFVLMISSDPVTVKTIEAFGSAYPKYAVVVPHRYGHIVITQSFCSTHMIKCRLLRLHLFCQKENDNRPCYENNNFQVLCFVDSPKKYFIYFIN